MQLATVLMYAKIAAILLVLSGTNPFALAGMRTPRFFEWMTENKAYACLMSWFVTGFFENALVSSGAFEVFYNDMPIWSKLESSRVPEFHEILHVIGTHHSPTFGAALS